MPGVEALRRLIEVAQRESGQPYKIRLFLLALNHGDVFQFKFYWLRNLDRDLQEDVLEVLRMDIMYPLAEPHYVIPGTSHLWVEWRQWYEETDGGRNC